MRDGTVIAQGILTELQEKIGASSIEEALFITGVEILRTKAVALRILNQLLNDKRTLALIIFAPLLVLTLIYFILNTTITDIKVGVVNAPQKYVENLYKNNITPIRCTESEAAQMLNDKEIIASVKMISGKVYVDIDGGNTTKATSVLATIEQAKKAMNPASQDRLDLKTEINYVYGASDLKMFDNFGSLFIGFLVFFFTFLISGISFLQERTTGTLEKLLSTPATSEFQMIQFIPIVIVPQIFFTGLFDLSPEWTLVGKFMPLYYVADALDKVMIRGQGLAAIALDTSVLLGLTLIFMSTNTLLLKRYRKI